MQKLIRFLCLIIVLSFAFCGGVFYQATKQYPITTFYAFPDMEPIEEEPPRSEVPNEVPVVTKSKPSHYISFTSTITILTHKPETPAYALKQADELAKLVKSLPSVSDIVINRIDGNTETDSYQLK